MGARGFIAGGGVLERSTRCGKRETTGEDGVVLNCSRWVRRGCVGPHVSWTGLGVLFFLEGSGVRLVRTR